MGLLGNTRRNPSPATAETVIGTGAAFDGTLDTPHGVCIEGIFRGKLVSGGTVLVTRAGRVEAEVEAERICVRGELTGNARARSSLELGETGHIRGDVETPSLIVLQGGTLEGTCRMPEEQPAQVPCVSLAAKAKEKLLPGGRKQGRKDSDGGEVPAAVG